MRQWIVRYDALEDTAVFALFLSHCCTILAASYGRWPVYPTLCCLRLSIHKYVFRNSRWICSTRPWVIFCPRMINVAESINSNLSLV
ncbi:hypothetical protein M438DRAFT_103593 [Aureobasidium pullulans EXF-150]|uniref:Uncharacterized protein n=1 Tax=Aureobasidium pullulans EXF-150 TaxID=1043002 RepID=A0A074XAT5_AURPU|nr:uncharacterized protein M438DRAFT_103593 [Aureobasidium pullulans EXF-150]KEQ80854.1 hypothetical protein M438DRAFT_103593 [Aureobasidium pullulans EXF-150]